ncbi:hypothetical protein ABEV34_04640 [Methylorubrum rhodesianum]|jgi:hypothetical protein|uniref:hypothetical protein n=1 Tax=Methylorubrum rhodesianum TaxID=29427 RepID=UPI003D2B89FC
MLVHSLVGDKNRERCQGDLLAALGKKDTFGYPSWPLPNAKDLSANEFWRGVNSYIPTLWVWCGTAQIEGESYDFNIFYDGRGTLAGGGYAVLSPRGWKSEKPAIYVRWTACDHKWRSKTVGNCLTRYTCERCGSAHEVDSSG